jgi:DNA-directed RNA polymerase specialized sigma24 family protein
MSDNFYLTDFLKRIDDRDKCICLMKIQGYSSRDIGDILGITRQAVEKRISKTQKVFKRLYI